MDFRVGGFWLYATLGPAGECHRGRMAIHEIDHGAAYAASDAFADADGTINEALPAQQIELSLTESGGQTHVTTIVQYANIDAMNTILEMGLAEGMTAAHDQLEALLSAT